MWWTSLGLGGALLFSVPGSGQGLSCPASFNNHGLDMVTVLDGDPKEKAILMPDHHKGTMHNGFSDWEVSYIYAAGRQVFLQCHYAHTEPAADVMVKVERKVSTCIFHARPKGVRAEASCK
jgi:hypothetical protein